MRSRLALCLGIIGALLTGVASPMDAQGVFVLRPDRVFDGESMHEGWAVLVRDGRIGAAGPSVATPSGAVEMSLPGTTLLPGLIEGHSHLLLHPYDETSRTDQVLLESRAERVARATVHARATLLAGVTTVRDLGSEGAGYADVGVKAAIDKGVIPGPRMLVSGPAMVATGSYNPRGAPEWDLPKGAEETDGYDDLMRVTRDQIGSGADWVKVYADYRWGPNGEARPTYPRRDRARGARHRELGSARRGTRLDGGGDGACGAGRRPYDRARRRRNAGGVRVDGRARRRLLPHAVSGRCHRSVRRRWQHRSG